MRLIKTGYVLLNTDNKSTIIVSNFKASMCAEKQTLTSTFKKLFIGRLTTTMCL